MTPNPTMPVCEDPRDRKILNIRTGGKLRRHGLPQIDFESAEPSFDDLDPRVFFRRFPEGEYDIVPEAFSDYGGSFKVVLLRIVVKLDPRYCVQIWWT